MREKLNSKKQAASDAHKYTYRVEWSDEDGVYVARVLEFPSLSAHGDDSLAAHLELLKVLEAVLKDMIDSGEKIPAPFGLQKFAGKIPLRVTPDLHKRLKIEAAERDVSLNHYLVSKLASDK